MRGGKRPSRIWVGGVCAAKQIAIWKLIIAIQQQNPSPCLHGPIQQSDFGEKWRSVNCCVTIVIPQRRYGSVDRS